jgi:hypothetical protein
MKVNKPKRTTRRNQSVAAPAWEAILVDDVNIKPAMKRILREYYGADLRLGDIAQLPWSEVLLLPGVGQVGADSCVTAISRAMRGNYRPTGPTLLDMASR